MSRHLHQPYSDILMMPFYDIILLIEAFQEAAEAESGESGKSNTQSNQQHNNPNKFDPAMYQKMQQQQMADMQRNIKAHQNMKF